jgi:5-methylcytosine-specific restriction endonuclease McrA
MAFAQSLAQSEDDTHVHIPIRCTVCGKTKLVEFPTLVVVTALTRWNHMRLHSDCHHSAWDAGRSELTDIRNYLGRNWIESHRSQLYFEPALP